MVTELRIECCKKGQSVATRTVVPIAERTMEFYFSESAVEKDLKQFKTKLVFPVTE